MHPAEHRQDQRLLQVAVENARYVGQVFGKKIYQEPLQLNVVPGRFPVGPLISLGLMAVRHVVPDKLMKDPASRLDHEDRRARLFRSC
ncbi:MAG TPA: hypothetical protein VGI78_07805 [Acetobacteraceae bacterium]|jgi:hypothetical protein